MGQKIDQFCNDLHIKLANIDSGLASLKAIAPASAATTRLDERRLDMREAPASGLRTRPWRSLLAAHGDAYP